VASSYDMCKVIYHPEYSKYNLVENHPFSPVRIQMVLDLLAELGIEINYIQPQKLKPDDLIEIHDKEYIQIVEAISRGEDVPDIETYGLGTQDNPVVKGMAEGARLQAGGTVLGARLLIDGKANKVMQMGGGFHHAHYNFAAGFCIYNDLALAINEMIKNDWHIAYLDLDVHHGDGVQELFYADGRVMTISVHESGEYIFPGTGWQHELGKGMGRSLKLNLPLEPFTEGDSYLEVLDNVVQPALQWFRPDALVVQAGADTHFSDPLADMMLTTQDFEKIYNKVIDFANKFTKGRILVTLGGGYSLFATARIWTLLYLILNSIDIPDKLPEKWLQRWQSSINKKDPALFHDPNPAFPPIPRRDEIINHNRELIRRIMDAVSPDWL